MSYLKNLLCQNLTDLNIDIKDKNIGISLSGGADSTALFFCLLELKKDINFEISIFHLNHLIRNESFEEEEFIKNLAQFYNLNYLIVRFDCLKYKKKSKESLEMLARRIRYEYISEFIRIYNINYFFTAHHLDDQCETILMRLFKGTGLFGITGINKIRGKIVRPFFNLEKRIIYDYLKENNIKYFEDRTNYDINYERNFLRNIVLRDIEKKFKNYRYHILNFVELLTKVNEYVFINLNKKIDLNNINNFIEISELNKLEEVEKYYFIYYIIKKKLSKENLNKAIFQNIFNFLNEYERNNKNKIIYEDKILIIIHSYGKIYFYKREFLFNIIKKIPSNFLKINIGENRFFYYNLYCEKKNLENLFNNYEISKNSLNKCFYIDKDKIDGILVVDLWKEGDYIYYDKNKKKKLKKVFIEKKIPSFLRKFILTIKIIKGEYPNNIIISNLEDPKFRNFRKNFEVIGFYFDKKYYLSKNYYINNKSKNILKIDVKEGINFYG